MTAGSRSQGRIGFTDEARVESQGDWVSSEPQELAAMLADMRKRYQSHLLASVQAKKALDADILDVKTKAEQIASRFAPDARTIQRFERAWDHYGQPVSAPDVDVLSDSDTASQAWTVSQEACTIALTRHGADIASWKASKKPLFKQKPGPPSLPPMFLHHLQLLRQIVQSHEALRVDYLRDAVETAVPPLRARYEAQAAAREGELTAQLQSCLAALQMGIELLGTSGLPWEGRLPSDGGAAARAAMRLGSMASNLPHPFALEVPCVISFPSTRSLAIEAGMDARGQALQLLRSIVLRSLFDVPAGRLHLSLIDPSGMGQTFAEFVHLGDYDERLIDVGVKTSSHAIERCLAENVIHIETVISKYLRGQFSNIHDYNCHAGEMVQPYRLIVLADFPRQVSEPAAEQLLSLIENGPRCGVYVLLHYAPVDEDARGVPLVRLTQGMDVVRVGAGLATVHLATGDAPIEFKPDACPAIAFDVDGRPTTPSAERLDTIGRAAKRGSEVVVTLANFLPVVNRNRAGALPDFIPGAPPLSEASDSWWSATTSDQAVAFLGRSGAQGVASMFFSSTAVAGGAIMVGLPRSGKTTALHSMILTMAMLYSPEELELYLIDAKHGVEFKAYEHLPHARMVSVHSERQFSLAVLKGVQSKIQERAELIKSSGLGLSNITEYRHATGENVPRIVVIIDEFRELFEEADTIGLEAFAAFSDIVKMGTFSGVHVVVASQTLSSMPAMDRQTLTLLPQRVAFMCNEYDAEIVMGDVNPAARTLNKTGQGLFNPARGDESQNQPFQGLYVAPDQRGPILRTMRQKADASGWTRRPRVFDGHAGVARRPMRELITPGPRFIFPVGEPFTLAESESVTLARSRGGNCILVGDVVDEGSADLVIRGALHSLLLAAEVQNAVVSVVDFVGDEELDASTRTVLDVAELSGARYARSSQLESVVAELATVVSTRITAGDYRSPTRVLVLFGVQRALSLAPHDPYADDEQQSYAKQLAAIIAAGPEVGVHVVVSTDRLRSLEMRLGPHALSEFAFRIAGSAADQRDLASVVGDYGDIVSLRHGQLLIGDLMKGNTRRARGFSSMSITDPGNQE